MSKTCPNCGTQVVDDANFCQKCGYDFRPAQEQVPVAAPAQTANPQARPWVQNSGIINPNPVPGYDTYNPTFHCRCEYCYFEFDYHSYDLGHRAWYPHGFVYCPRCQRPLRHKLEYEVIGSSSVNQQNDQPVQPADPS